jgi:hypothetical protein
MHLQINWQLPINHWQLRGSYATRIGVHASASPFEAMAERINWTGATLESDGYGKAMLAAGIPRATVEAWTEDPQVGGLSYALWPMCNV